MSNRAATKQIKRERPKSSEKLKKKRDGTPEKLAMSAMSQELFRDVHSAIRDVIMNDEIEALAIKHEDLQKFHVSTSPMRVSSLPPRTVTVKKTRPTTPTAASPTKLVVARPAMPDSPLKQVDRYDMAGIRYDDDGEVIPHSILGNYEDFRNEALRLGQTQFLRDPVERPLPSPAKKVDAGLVVKPVKRTKHLNEQHALKHWQECMGDRENIVKIVANKVNKDPGDLLMSTTDDYREKQEIRQLIDRTIPLIDYGKGYRVGSEFWKQYVQLGDEDRGLQMALTKTEQGNPPPFETIGLPWSVKRERVVGNQLVKNEGWKRSRYLSQRISQLRPYIKELCPYIPEFGNLEIVSTKEAETEIAVNQSILESYTEEKENKNIFDETSDPLFNYPDVHGSFLFGPSLQFAGQPARWTGNTTNYLGETALEARVTFDTLTGKKVTSELLIVNDGTTVVHYTWEKTTRPNPFDVYRDPKQRFYFDSSNGSISPGESRPFFFMFLSEKGGIFTQQWRLMTTPVLCGGANLLVTLKGVAFEEDKYEEKRQEIDSMLEERQKNEIVTHILLSLVDAIGPAERPKSPINAYVTYEEAIINANPEFQLIYDVFHLNELGQVFQEACPDGEWNLTINHIKQVCMEIDDENEEKREELLQRLNAVVAALSFPRFSPKPDNILRVGTQLMREVVDCMVGESMFIRSIMNLPSKDQDDLLEEERKKAEKKEVPLKKSASKEIKSKNASKAEAKLRARGGARTPVRSGSSRIERRDSFTPSEPPPSPECKSEEPDPNLERKYGEKFYSQAYLILAEGIEKMVDAFEDLKLNEPAEDILDNIQAY